jgi:hypothetical protein
MCGVLAVAKRLVRPIDGFDIHKMRDKIYFNVYINVYIFSWQLFIPPLNYKDHA